MKMCETKLINENSYYRVGYSPQYDDKPNNMTEKVDAVFLSTHTKAKKCRPSVKNVLCVPCGIILWGNKPSSPSAKSCCAPMKLI